MKKINKSSKLLYYDKNQKQLLENLCIIKLTLTLWQVQREIIISSKRRRSAINFIIFMR